MDPARAAVRDRDHRLTARVGRTATLELAFERRGAATVLARAYVEPPFSVRRAFQLGDAAHVIVVTTGAGIFPGDTLRQSIHVGPGARAVLTSQSSMQAHPGISERPASIEQRCVVDDDGELHCEWDPVIPFGGARLDQRFAIVMERTARLWWSDALMSGRAGRGERWRFESLAHELHVEVAGALQYLERYLLRPSEQQPPARRIGARWGAFDADYLGTSLVRHPDAGADSAEAIHRAVTLVPGVRSAADHVESGLIAIRCAAADGVPFAAARAAARRAALERIFRSPHLFVPRGRTSV